MEKVSFKKVIRNDGYVISALVSFVVFAIILVVSLVIQYDISELGTYLILGLSAGSFIVVVIRILLILSFKPDNRTYKAKITKIFTYRSTKHITFEYTVDSSEYKKRNALLSTKFSRNLCKDDEIEIYVSQTNPAKALIKEAYFDSEVL
ncbi:MAG: hypothetical protein JEZ05_03175 [Tenericutes bacterium]|nr:hypothetical protein [Mycoplasmatota bacterium]